ncbi:MAG: hypothetical protein ABIN80_12145 [Dyadobacter sp.]|uniref:hypothetical protein n=1 Tax=Dyadobacter sp. TaxID=1914288 RepID=UPI003265858C
MIYVADVSSTGSQHEQFNSAFIHILNSTTGQNSTTFFTDETHGAVVQKNGAGLKLENITIYNKRGGIKEFVRAYFQYKNLVEILKKVRKENNPGTLYVLLIHPFAHFLFKQFGSAGPDIAFVLHGELESIKFNKHFVNKIWGWFLKKALTKKRADVKYIILGESIYRNLVKVLPVFLSQPSIILDHPYPFTTNPAKSKVSSKIVFSSFGVATVSKNTQYIFDVALKIQQLNLLHLCKFNIIGQVYKNMTPYLNDAVDYKKNFAQFTRVELNPLMSESDFAVFYYDNANYSLCASGAFWDAINAEVPLLYVHNDYFDHYAAIVGDIGVAFDNPIELNEFIISIVKNSNIGNEYSHFLENIRSLKYDYMKRENLLKQLHPLAREV